MIDVFADDLSTVILKLFLASLILLVTGIIIQNIFSPIPGPWNIPLFGSVSLFLDFFSSARRRGLCLSLPKKYGRVLAFRIGSHHIVWLNDLKTVKEAFVDNAISLSDRMARSNSSYKMNLHGKGIVTADYGKYFKHRKKVTVHSMVNFGLGGRSLEDMVLSEAEYAVLEFSKFADTNLPSDVHAKVIYVAVSNVICSVVFGKRFDFADPEFNKAINAIKYLLGKSTVFWQFVPILNLVPSVRALREKSQSQVSIIRQFISSEVERHKEGFDVNSPRDFVDMALKIQVDAKDDNSYMDNEDIIRIIMDLFFAGTDTTATALVWLLLYLIRYPDIQKKCQREIDSVLGSDKSLTKVTSLKEMPYLMSVLLETQRISSMVPLTVAHRARKETEVDGFRIPKDSLVYGNICNVHFDETYWKGPKNFLPGRWLDENDPTKVVEHSHFIPFSIGKRRCLGEHLAKVEYQLFALALLSKFEFSIADPDDLPSLDVDSLGLVQAPQPFRMIINTREI